MYHSQFLKFATKLSRLEEMAARKNSSPNFNGVAFEYHNGSWTRVHNSVKNDRLKLMSFFIVTTDHVSYLLKGCEKPELISMNSMAELSGLMEERRGTILSDVIQETHDKNNLNFHLPFFDKLKTGALILFP